MEKLGFWRNSKSCVFTRLKISVEKIFNVPQYEVAENLEKEVADGADVGRVEGL